LNKGGKYDIIGVVMENNAKLLFAIIIFWILTLIPLIFINSSRKLEAETKEMCKKEGGTLMYVSYNDTYNCIFEGGR